MFWKNLIFLCNKKNTTPTNVVKELGIAVGSVTKWKNGVVPRSTTLQKIADYFGVTVESLLTDTKGAAATPSAKVLSPVAPELGMLTQHEINVLLRYRSKPELQGAVDKLLDVPDSDSQLIPAYVAALSQDGTPDRIEYLTPEEVKRLENAPPVDFDF